MALSRLATVTGGLLLFAAQISAQHEHPSPAAATMLPGTRPASEALSGDVARGQYIVEHIAMCAECHSSRDEHGDIITKTRFLGGPMPVSPPWPNGWANRTPRIAGLPGYTNELAIRLLTQGAIGRDGQQLRLPMPRFRMTPEDALAVAAYLRTKP